MPNQCPFCGFDSLMENDETFTIVEIDGPILDDDPDNYRNATQFECLECLRDFWIEAE